MPAKHHYVPQFYLKYFACDENANQVWAYTRDGNPFRTNVLNIANEKNFYTYTDIKSGDKTDELEKLLSQQEGNANAIITKFSGVGKLQLSEEDKGELSFFLAMLHTRGLSHRKQTSNAFGELHKFDFQLKASNKENFTDEVKKLKLNKSDKEIEELRQWILEGKYEINFNPRDEYFLKTSLEMSTAIYPHIFNKDFYIVESSSNRVFITSDNPVIILHTNANPMRGEGIANGIIALPVSPKKCLILINNEMEPPLLHQNKELVNQINHQVMFHAHRNIYSNLSSRDIQQEFNTTKSGASEKFVIGNNPFA